MTPRPYKIATFQRLLWLTGWGGKNEPDLTENLRLNLPHFWLFPGQESLRFGGSSS